MKQVEGIWLPDEDIHFEHHLVGSKLVDGKGTYQYKKYLAAISAVRNFGLAVDVGAHVGLWTRVMALNFGRVFAFEPIARHRECLVANVSNLHNVEIWPFAVSDVTGGTLRMHETLGNSGNAHVLPRGHGELVQSITLDGVQFPTRVNLLKIDVEGFETKVVAGGEGMIKRDRPVIVIEQKPNNAERYGFTQFEALDQLMLWGYRKVAAISGDYVLA